MDEETRRILRQRWLSKQENDSSVALAACNADKESSSSSSSTTATASKGTKRPRSTVAPERKPKKEDAIVDLTLDDDVEPVVSSATAEDSSDTASFSVATYNVWFGPPHPEIRMRRVASCLTTASPLLFGLQEVTPELASYLFPPLEAAGYAMVIQKGVAYGCALGVDVARCRVVDSGFRPYADTVMERGLLWARVRLGEREIVFGTTHLESFMRNYPTLGATYTGSSQRRSQIREATRFVVEEEQRRRGAVDASFVVGDLNWDDERKRSKGPDEPLLSTLLPEDDAWRDLWSDAVALGRTDPNDAPEGYTYDSKINPMLGGNLRRRFDRLLVCCPKKKKSTTAQISLERIGMIGKEPIEGFVYEKQITKWGSNKVTGTRELPLMPSDHFGLVATIKIV